MDSNQFHRRVWVMVLLLALMLTGMGSTLYDLQINHGDEYYRRSQYKIAETHIIDAARGEILDRNGQVLVSNKVIYQVTLDPTLMGDRRNEVILTLIRLARESGVEWNDSLAVSKEPPFVYTSDEPLVADDVDEEGKPYQRLTRLGRLAVRLDWMKDPLAKPEEESRPEEPGFFDKLKDKLTGKKPAPPAPPKEEGLPDANKLIGRMLRAFDVRGPGAIDPDKVDDGVVIPTINIGTMPPEDARAVVGVLYEMALRTYEVYHVPYIFAEDVGIDFISRVKELSLPGVIIETTSVRQYNTTYAAHLLGRTGPIYENEWADYKDLDIDGDGEPDYQMDDIVGKDGVESAFEEYLRGKPGTLAVERNTDGKIVSSTWLEEPQPGNNVILTLDIGLQAQIEDMLAVKAPALKAGVEGAACVVIDVHTGAVLAAASYPTFNLSTFSEDYEKNYNDPLMPMFNRALQGLYAPGSTFKPCTSIAGLEEGIITPTSIINTKGIYTYYPDYHPRCWIYREYGGTHGPINVSKALEVSCNYFYYDVGRRLGIENLQKYAKLFGLSEKTGIELYEEKGVMAGPEYTESLGGTWYEGNTMFVAIGQESNQFTPIQLANYTATLANGGTRYATHLMKEVKSGDFTRVVETYEPKVMEQIDIAPQNLNAVFKGMHNLTLSASQHKFFKRLNVEAAAKTGSAQVAAKPDSNGLFITFAPYEDPEIAVALVVEQCSTATPLGDLAVDVLDFYFSSKESMDVATGENSLIR